MKKWMFFALVLCVVGLANGSIYFAGDWSIPMTWKIVGIDNTGAIGGYLFTQNGTKIVDFQWTYTGSLRAFDEITDPDIVDFFVDTYGPISQLFEVNFADASGIPLLPNGDLVSFRLENFVDVTLTDGDGNIISEIVWIPEPLTMGLLALGGLFIRRKNNFCDTN